MMGDNYKKNTRKYLLIAIALGLFLYATNPTKVDFKDYIANEMEALVEDSAETPSDNLNQLLLAVGSIVADGTAVIADKLYVREDYLFFSVYTMTVFNEEFKYLGVSTKFFDMNNSNN